MGELALKYLRSSLHYIRVLLQCRSGLGYRSTLIQYISSVNLPVQHFLVAIQINRPFPQAERYRCPSFAP
jgi:hypothetical protein